MTAAFPKSLRLEDRLKFCLDLAKSVAPLMLEGFSLSPGAEAGRRQGLDLESKKSFRDLVTVYDRQVEERILAEISRRFPGEAIVGEEATAASSASPREVAQSSELFWVVDPIDGTTNFARAYPFFCTTMALMRWLPNGSSEGLIGVTYNPVSEELFWASKGGGAWINRQRMQVSNISNLQESLLTTGFASLRSTEDPRSFELFSKLTSDTLGVRRDGSAALDMAYVAAGRIDAYWEWGLSPWDLGAGLLLVQEAAGIVTKHGGQEFSVFDGEVLASNSNLHSILLEKLS